MNIKILVSEKFYELFRSNQSKLFIFFAIIAIILAAVLYKNIIVSLIQLVLYYLIIEEINCKIYGGCIFNSWIVTIIPIAGIVIFILDYFHIFKSLKSKIKYLYEKYERIIPEGKIDMNINNNNIPI
jgi:uncharacterized membrane protein